MNALEQRLAKAKAKMDMAKIKADHAQALYSVAKARYEMLANSIGITCRIKAIKAEKGVTYEDIAAKMGCSKQYAEEYISKGRLAPERLCQIASALGVTTEFIYNGKDDTE